MIPTLHTFTRALLSPDLSFRTLGEARAVTDANGVPQLCRTSRFVEAEIEWQGQRWLLSMPLTAAALPRIERTASRLRSLRSPWLLPYRLLHDEMSWCDAAGNSRSTGLVLQLLPPGVSLEEACRTERSETLLAALDALEHELRTLHIAHNNLKETNLRWSAGRLLPLRYHDAECNASAEADGEAFAALRSRIAAITGCPDPRDPETAADILPQLPGHRWTSHLFEGLICVEDESGFGFVDAENRPVIAAQFRWAGDFREGRAEVETPTGMGLIDRQGNYVIPPRYEIVDYDPATSLVQVRHEGRWATFDYLGRQLTEFGAENGMILDQQ